MTLNQARDWRERNRILGMERLSLTPTDWRKILLVSNRLRRLYEAECNGFPDAKGNWDQEAEKQNHDKQTHYETKAQEFAKAHNLYLYLQTDCRGATVYLDTKPIPENNYTNAVCVY